MRIEVWGEGKDTIQVDGDIQAEFKALDGEIYLAFSEGSVIFMHRDEKDVWRIKPKHLGSGAGRIAQGLDIGRDGNISDHIVIIAEIKWVLLGSQLTMREPGGTNDS